jgi:acylphosphatase
MNTAVGSAGIVARRARVHGRVQGVWFRASTAEQARVLGVSGHARNLDDGTVEVFAVGADAAVQALMAWLSKGPPMAEVSTVQVEDASDQPVVTGFTVG